MNLRIATRCTFRHTWGKHVIGLSSTRPRKLSTGNQFLRISEEVREALHAKRPVVALETTIYTHGMDV